MGSHELKTGLSVIKWRKKKKRGLGGDKEKRRKGRDGRGKRGRDHLSLD